MQQPTNSQQPMNGYFRSEIYFHGKYYDTAWSVFTSASVQGGYEVLVKQCRDIRDAWGTEHLRESLGFKQALLIRARQIRATKQSQ